MHLCVVGRLRPGPQKTLIDDYLERFHKTGRNIGLSLGHVSEVEARKGGGKLEETDALRKALPNLAATWILDERGQVLSSPDFAKELARQRDQGTGDLAFVIGGADGIASDLLNKADRTLSLGRMVWPHMLARIMLSEQLYRAATILSGGPYHRD